MDDSLDTGVPHIARVYNYWLGGTDNFPADRAAAQQVMASFPDITVSVRAQRAFLGRAVRYLVTEGGLRQFLDSALAYRRRATPTRWPSAPRRSPGWSTWTTTRSWRRTPARC